MSITFPFSGAARSFLDQMYGTRRSLADMANRMKSDARHARSWGFYAIGATAAKLLSRQSDKVVDRDGMMQSYAKRAIEWTHSMDDPEQVAQFKADMLQDNIDGITVEDLDGFIADHMDEIVFHGVSDSKRDAMLSDVRRQMNTQPSEASPHLSGPV